MSEAGRVHQIEVQDNTGKLGTVERNLTNGLWRATRRPPLVWVGGQQLRPNMRGSGKDAELFVRLPAGASLPKDLAGVHG
jgi:hypothetical protein